MRLSDLLTSGVFLLVALLHFGLQWYGWKIHLGEIPTVAEWQGDQVWRVFSFPLFALLSRRVQHLHFFEVLVANSVLWGAVLVWGTKAWLGIVRRATGRTRASRTRLHSSVPLRTETDRLVELKKLFDQGLISGDEYQRKRDMILRGL